MRATLDEWERSLERLIVSRGAARALRRQRAARMWSSRYSMRAYRATVTSRCYARLAAPHEEVGMLPRMHAVHIYQILNHYTSRAGVGPGFRRAGQLRERASRLVRVLADPKIPAQRAVGRGCVLRLSVAEISPQDQSDAPRWCASSSSRSDAATDVFLFSPSIHNSAYFLNVFEHGESEHPGLARRRGAASSRASIRPSTLDALVSDSRNTVHSNYFVAKPRFWRAWLAINERMFAIAETRDDPLGEELRAPTSLPGTERMCR